MKVSIITVVLNNQDFLQEAIESVLHQSYQNIEYIIVDGGSKDGSLNIIQQYGNQITKIISEPDNGIYDAMNKGLALATGEVIGFLNADDFYAHKQVIEHVVQRFSTNHCEVVYADLNYVSRTDKNKIIRKWRSGNYYAQAFEKGWMPPHPTFFATQSAYQKWGGYVQELNQSADYELMLRFLYLHQAKCFYLPEVLVHMRVGGQSNRSFKNRLMANIQDRKAWKINQLRPKWYTLLLKPVSKIAQFF